MSASLFTKSVAVVILAPRDAISDGSAAIERPMTTQRRTEVLSKRRVAVALAAIPVVILSACLWGAPPVLEVYHPYPDARVAIRGQTESPSVPTTLFGSRDLEAWSPVAQFTGNFDFVDFQAAELSARFYRLHLDWVSPEWKNQVKLANEPFTSAATGWIGFRWIKFLILADEPWRIYFQNTSLNQFHFDFAKASFPEFAAMSLEEFNQITLHPGPGQRAILGALLFPPPTVSTNEYGIQFVGVSPFPPEQVRDLMELVRSTVLPRTALAVYMPVPEQRDAALASARFFEENGIALGSAERWVTGDVCYSAGWAQGRLVQLPATEIPAAYAAGQLSNENILLIDAVPAELPYVQGIIALSPATPNSHVAILANAYKQPFIFLQPSRTNEVLKLQGREIMLVARVTPLGNVVRLIDLEGQIDARAREELAAMKSPPPLSIASKQPHATWSASTDELTPADTKYFGGKAANYGFLRRAIPDDSYEAIAFSFDLWDAFMDQTLPSGGTLRNEIAARMNRHQFPPNIPALRADLAAIRTLITTVASFNSAQRQIVLAALAPFDPSRKIRFRSSTNVEDIENFTGAGLYDSYSGCVLDDSDGDNAGPSRCDPAEPEERGVFRAIQKVFASFYNENAVVERMRHGIDESQVGMALLVHHSFPDEIEVANGVATLENRGSFIGTLVSQKGAVSVTNPGGGAQPEVMRFTSLSSGTSFQLEQPSELLPLGQTVLGFDYGRLVELIERVSKDYRTAMNKQGTFSLDFEYKKVAPGKLIVKQVRELPRASSQPVNPFLVNERIQLAIKQGVGRGWQDIFTVHRLKSLWSIETKNMRLTETNLAETIYANLDLTYATAGQGVQQVSGPISSWANATNWLDGDSTVDSWILPKGSPRCTWQLRVPDLKRPIVEHDVPIRTLADLVEFQLTALHEAPVVSEFGPTNLIEETISLVPVGAPLPSDKFVESTFSHGEIAIETSYWLRPPAGYGVHAGWPLVSFAQTTIRGLTSQEITLRGYFSQSYTADEFNAHARFIFEPDLEPDLSGTLRDELKAMDVRAILVNVTNVSFIGWDDRVRDTLQQGATGR